MAQQRVKICASCKERIPYDAPWCPECDAGRPEERDDAPPAAERPAWASPVLVGSVIAILIGLAAFIVLTQKGGEERRDTTRLREQQEELRERITAADERHPKLVEEAKALKAEAKRLYDALDLDAYDKAKKRADELMDEAVALAAARDRDAAALQKIEDELEALGETP